MPIVLYVLQNGLVCTANYCEINLGGNQKVQRVHDFINC